MFRTVVISNIQFIRCFILLLVLILVLQVYTGYGQENKTTIKQYNDKLQTYLLKDPELKDYIDINQDGIYLYESPLFKKKNVAEFYISWEELPILKKVFLYSDRDFQFNIYRTKGVLPFDPQLTYTLNILASNHQYQFSEKEQPLSGFRIAIDPGHIAGNLDLAMIENRFIDITHDSVRYTLKEGELTLTTAMILKDSLENYGAEVIISRQSLNQGASEIDYETWNKKHLDEKLEKLGYSEKEIKLIKYRLPQSALYQNYYLRDDLELRAEKINYFKPDLTVIIHFNADDKNVGWRIPTPRNYSMVFIPGGFLKDELHFQRDRFDLLRLLVSDIVQESYDLSNYIIHEFEQQLNVEAVNSTNEPNYLKNAGLKLSEGVYARNLRLSRLIHSPLCYGEPFLQDNLEELKSLNDNDYSSKQYSKRLVKVANSYLIGILNYVERKKSAASNH